MDKAKRRLSVILLILVVAAAIFFSLITYITDYMWFKEMGYVDVFFKQLVTQLKVGVPTFAVITGLVILYLNHLKKGYFKRITSKEDTDMKKLRLTTVGLSLIFGAFVAFTTVSQLWFEILKFANSTDFDISDPLFNLDISFYIFKLEFLTELNDILIGVIIGFVILTILYYVILMTVRTPDVFKERDVAGEEAETDQERYGGNDNPFFGSRATENKGAGSDPFVKFAEAFTGKKAQPRAAKPKKQFDDDNFKQLMSIASGKMALLGFIFFLMIGVNFFLKQFDLLNAHTGAVYGAGYTDVNVTLWVYRILCVLAVVAALLFVVNMRKKNYKALLTVPVIMIVIGLAGTGVASLVQNLIVSPDEINKESTYLAWNIEYTQYAYQLDNVTVQDFAADDTLTADDINDNSETINNIRVNDFSPATQFYNQTQSIRQYYTFNDVDVDRYVINGKYTQTFLATREIDESKISDTWLNMHLKYTHGYGVTLSRVDQVTSSGQPDVLIGDIPPESSVDEIEITQPEIYFGELSNEYIVVGTDEAEFDYPEGESNAYTYYEGDAGIKLNLFNRILFSIREGSLKLLVSSNIDSDSKIIINRNIIDRVTTIMPYLTYEDDPYMVIIDGSLYWILDAYTTSSYYPYAEAYNGTTNYIRNSVKVVIDAYNGDVDFYIIDEDDPIAMTYAQIYPTLFKMSDEMSDELKAHLRYPNNLLEIQATVYAKYHMEDVNVFYQSEDLWDIAYEIYGTERVQMTPSYYIAKLPGEDSAEFFNSIAFTPMSKMNMTALLIARNDGDNYGELVLYQFPKSTTVYGPEQIEAQIDQDTEIAKEFSLWNSSGTSYSRGNMFIIPINTSLLYVEPIYLEATNSSIPEVKRIIMFYNDTIAYGESVADCLVTLFGSGAEDSVDSDVSADDEEDTADDAASDQKTTGDSEGSQLTQSQLIDKAVEAFENAQEAQQSGDWASYGEYLAELEDYLTQLAE